MRSSFEFKRVRRVARRDVVHEVWAGTHIYRLGYSFVEIHETSIDMHARYWVLATPVDSEREELVLVNQVRQMRKPRKPIMDLRFLPVNLHYRVMNQILLSQQERDVEQDVVIWERMRNCHQPRLCRAYGPIGAYRRYCRQFYPELTVSKAS